MRMILVLIRVSVVVFIVSMGFFTTFLVTKLMSGHEYFLFAIAIVLSCNALPAMVLSFIIWNATMR